MNYCNGLTNTKNKVKNLVYIHKNKHTVLVLTFFAKA